MLMTEEGLLHSEPISARRPFLCRVVSAGGVKGALVGLRAVEWTFHIS